MTTYVVAQSPSENSDGDDLLDHADHVAVDLDRRRADTEDLDEEGNI